MYNGSPAGHYVAPGILGNGATTTFTVQNTGTYFVSVMLYRGTTGRGKLTLTFTCR